jgi:LysR family transcriptional regulator, hydrogen peroxide-inducible genes activator
MTLVELRFLVTLSQTRHFGRAAELCNVTQSALSMAIRKLEEELDVLLFERSKSGIQPTQMGEQIIGQAKLVVSQADRIKALAEADKDQLRGELKIGAIFTLGPYLLPQLIPSLKLIASDLSVQCYEGYNSDLRHKLRSGELDGILISKPFVEADVLTQEIYSEPLHLVMPLNHPLAARSTVAPDDLHGHTFLVLSERQCLREQMLAVHQPDAQNMIECSSLDTLRQMIVLGLGISILPFSATSSAMLASQTLVTRPLQTNPARKIFLAWRASFPRHKAIDAVRRAIHANTWQFITAQDTGGPGLMVENQSW